MQATGDLARRYALRALDAMAAADPEFDVAVAPSAGTAEGVLEIQVAQIRGAAEKFASSVIPNGRTATRTGPLDALIIGGWVCGLSDRDIESLVSEAGLRQIPKSTVSTQELRALPGVLSSGPGRGGTAGAVWLLPGTSVFQARPALPA